MDKDFGIRVRKKAREGESVDEGVEAVSDSIASPSVDDRAGISIV